MYKIQTELSLIDMVELHSVLAKTGGMAILYAELDRQLLTKYDIVITDTVPTNIVDIKPIELRTYAKNIVDLNIRETITIAGQVYFLDEAVDALSKLNKVNK